MFGDEYLVNRIASKDLSSFFNQEKFVHFDMNATIFNF
jgi:hypothetical protein